MTDSRVSVMRINARLDEELERKISYILDHKPMTQSELVKNAIDLYYDVFKNENESSFKVLSESGFIGGGSGPKDLSKNYKKYGDKLEADGSYVRKNGKIWGLQSTIALALIYFKGKDMRVAYNEIGASFGDIGSLGNYSKEVKSEIDGIIKKFHTDKETVHEGYFFEINPGFSTNSIISSILSGTDANKTFILIKPEIDFYRISVRRQDGKIDCSEFVKGLVSELKGADGGGHARAAGGRFMKTDLGEIRRRLGLSAFR